MAQGKDTLFRPLPTVAKREWVHKGFMLPKGTLVDTGAGGNKGMPVVRAFMPALETFQPVVGASMLVLNDCLGTRKYTITATGKSTFVGIFSCTERI